MSKIKALIVDDSVVYRTQVRAALDGIAEVEVIGVASNGEIALSRLSQQAGVDLIILDLEMPVMDGLQTLRELKNLRHKAKVIVFSSISKRGAEITMEALSLGASDFATKPDGRSDAKEDPKEKIRNLLLPKIRGLFLDAFIKNVAPIKKEIVNDLSNVAWDLLNPDIVVIGSSTGGPAVLEKIFAQFSGPFNCPIVIAQHMPPIFTATLIERLGKLTGVAAKEAAHGELLANQLYIAPGNFHLRLVKKGTQVMMELDQGEQINFVRPAVDPLFETAAAIFKNKCLGIVLTGMGHDGKNGAKAIKDKGGCVLIQDQKSCVVFGMPGAIYNAGYFDLIESPDNIAAILIDKVGAQKKIKLGA